jgi:hypothetical protein
VHCCSILVQELGNFSLSPFLLILHSQKKPPRTQRTQNFRLGRGGLGGLLRRPIRVRISHRLGKQCITDILRRQAMSHIYLGRFYYNQLGNLSNRSNLSIVSPTLRTIRRQMRTRSARGPIRFDIPRIKPLQPELIAHNKAGLYLT